MGVSMSVYWRNLNWLWLAALVISLDAATKWLASRLLSYGEPIELTGFFNLTLLHNHGAAFSFLASQDGWQRWGFSALALGVSLGLLIWLLRLPPAPDARAQRRNGLLKVGIVLIIGGALGNLIDRLSLGYVVDFLDFHAAGYHWPAFNVADSAITVGVGLLLLAEVLLAPNAKKPAAPSSEHPQ